MAFSGGAVPVGASAKQRADIGIGRLSAMLPVEALERVDDHELSPAVEEALEHADVHEVSPAVEETGDVGEGDGEQEAARCRGYPNMEGSQFNLSHHDFGRRGDEPASSGTVRMATLMHRFFNQVGWEGQRDSHGKFVRAEVAARAVRLLCMFEDASQLFCTQDGGGNLKMNYQIDIESLDPRTCAPQKLGIEQLFGSTPVYADPSTGNLTLVREDVVGFAVMLGSKPAPAAVELGRQGGAAAFGAAALPCTGCPTVSGQSFNVTHYEFFRQGETPANQGSVKKVYDLHGFTSQVNSRGEPDDHGRFSIVQINSGHAYFLCMFVDAERMVCTKTQSGNIVMRQVVDARDVDPSTCKAESLSLPLGYGPNLIRTETQVIVERGVMAAAW